MEEKEKGQEARGDKIIYAPGVRNPCTAIATLSKVVAKVHKIQRILCHELHAPISYHSLHIL